MKENISKILIVEDDYRLATEWQTKLIDKGFKVDLAANSVEAKLLLKNNYHCFIIDLFHVKDGVFLPDGGIHFISNIRRHERPSNVKSLIIAVTGYYRKKESLTVSTGEISEQLGADTTIAKPINFSKIMQKIDEYSSNKSS